MLHMMDTSNCQKIDGVAWGKTDVVRYVDCLNEENLTGKKLAQNPDLAFWAMRLSQARHKRHLSVNFKPSQDVLLGLGKCTAIK